MAGILDSDYHEQIKIKNIEKLRAMQAELPAFCTLFFRGIKDKVGSRTCIAYAYDLQIFFNYLLNYVLKNNSDKIREIELSDLDKVTKLDIENYMEYLSLYKADDGTVHTNDERGKARKLSALKGLYNYFYEGELIKNNPASIVHSPKLHEKSIIRLEPNEVANLLDIVESGSDQESKHQQKFHNKTKTRDLAILTLLLGTGIRVSECVGLNIKDVDFDNCAVRVVRKGGNEAIVYFGDEVEDALRDYIEQRKKVIAVTGHEDALFLSMQDKRISVRAVEYLVKKYASQVTTLKKITPHKLRSTYGTNLYKESGDIYLVASVLGHKDVNTTRKHYADMDDDLKRAARNMVKMRKD
ncbi:MAG: tyrosine-type recombinase/integrase [Lachnospiraceae bacterium]|nr:tyrosine-type recombinase/integrase [Lachnospiraceae bacterium]